MGSAADHDAFLKASAAAAEALGAPPGTYVVRLVGSRTVIPIIGSVGGAPEPMKAPKDAKLERARAALAHAERQTGLRR